MTEKKKILVIADSPLAPSGVGTQTRYMIEALLKTEKYSFICMAGAIRHKDYRPIKVEPYGDDFLIVPVNGYGDEKTIREMLKVHKPDLLWFMTDPRFYVWLWAMEDEIRDKVPMLYYHVWDNYPHPDFNKPYYDSTDVICTISKVTDDIVRTVSPDVRCIHIPHAVNTDVFSKKPKSEWYQLRQQQNLEDKLVFFWNNRNARRKQSGTLIFWFKEFLDEVGHDKAVLVMHTEPFDQNGQNLNAIIRNLGLTDGQVRFSTNKMPASQLANVYNMADCTINIADAEGFGLGTLESLACETPIIVNMTGGLQEQVTDGENTFGEKIYPASKAIIGSQDVPYIYEDRVAKEDFLNAMRSFYSKTPEERAELGRLGREHVMKNYSMEVFEKSWQDTIEQTMNDFGSWDTRKGYKRWELTEIK